MKNRESMFNAILNKMKNPVYLYLCLSGFFICFNLYSFYMNSGANIKDFLFADDRDTFMDFFHSIEYVNSNNPYSEYNVLYPPLANLFFRLCFMFLPSRVTEMWNREMIINNLIRKTSFDMRTFQAPLMIYAFFLIASITLMSYFIDNYYCKNSKINKILLFAIVLSYGFIFAVERGNIIILSFIFLLIFITFYKSNNKIIKEIAILCLAISANLKLYPAMFGILLINEKEYKYAIKSFVYGVVLYIISMSFFDGGGGYRKYKTFNINCI